MENIPNWVIDGTLIYVLTISAIIVMFCYTIASLRDIKKLVRRIKHLKDS